MCVPALPCPDLCYFLRGDGDGLGCGLSGEVAWEAIGSTEQGSARDSCHVAGAPMQTEWQQSIKGKGVR